MVDIGKIQGALRREGVDGWLFFDHHLRDPLAYRVLGFQPASHVTRRWYYFIPVDGEPKGLVHRVEGGRLDELPGEKVPVLELDRAGGGDRAHSGRGTAGSHAILA